MFEPVEKLRGFKLKPDRYSYFIVSGTIKCSIPGSCEQLPMSIPEELEELEEPNEPEELK